MLGTDPLKVLVVDDTIFYRKLVSDILSDIPGVEVVGAANNGKTAMGMVLLKKPDILTLDVEMPEMNGIEVLEWLQQDKPEIGAIMLSTLTVTGGELTIRALELGAFDFIEKPHSDNLQENADQIKSRLSTLLRAYSRRREFKRVLRSARKAGGEGLARRLAERNRQTAESPAPEKAAAPRRKTFGEIIVIGISTGGPNALTRIIPTIPGDINVPILIVQHMPPVFTRSLAESLDAKSPITVREAKDGEPLEPNVALIAPGGRQMKIAAAADGKTRVIKITDDPPENSCKPSVDYLFRSVAEYYVGRAVGVVMTGMGNDGAKGLLAMKQKGARTIAQDESTSTVFGMPKEAIDIGAVDVIAPLDRIVPEILRQMR